MFVESARFQKYFGTSYKQHILKLVRELDLNKLLNRYKTNKTVKIMILFYIILDAISVFVLLQLI